MFTGTLPGGLVCSVRVDAADTDRADRGAMTPSELPEATGFTGDTTWKTEANGLDRSY